MCGAGGCGREMGLLGRWTGDVEVLTFSVEGRCSSLGLVLLNINIIMETHQRLRNRSCFSETVKLFSPRKENGSYKEEEPG